jgi:hypothetical protein
MVVVFKDKIIYLKSEHGEPPKITVQPQSTWLWLSQLIRKVELSDSLFLRGAQGGELKGYSPVLLG